MNAEISHLIPSKDKGVSTLNFHLITQP